MKLLPKGKHQVLRTLKDSEGWQLVREALEEIMVGLQNRILHEPDWETYLRDTGRYEAYASVLDPAELFEEEEEELPV